MTMPKSKLGFLLAAVYIFIAGLFFIYTKFACSTDALYCGMLGLIPILPTLLVLSLLPNINLLQPPSDFSLWITYAFALLIGAVLLYLIGALIALIHRIISPKITRTFSIGLIIAVIVIMGILGIRYFNKSGMKPNFSTNVNNPVNSRDYCQQDSDCVLTPQYQGCCPNGCEVEAVNIVTEEMRNKQYNCHLKKISCPAYKCPSSVNKEAVCEQNRCVMKEKQPQNSISAEQYKIIGSFTSPGESSFVKALGDTAYLTDISEGLLAIDVSNPEKPILLDKIKIGNGGAYALAVNPSGLFAVAGGYGNTKVALVDISNPRSLKIINEIDAKRSVQDITLSVLEVNDLFLAIDGPEVEIMKVEDFPFSLKRIVSQGVLEITNGGHINALTDYFDSTSNTPYLLLGQGENGISIYNFNLMTLSSQKLVSHLDIGYVNIVAADENYAYAGVGNGIKVIDLKTQKEIADIKVDEVWNFKVKNNILHVASGENGVQVLDISDIRNPKQMALIDTPGRARSVDVSMDGEYIYVADDRDDLQIIGLQ